MIIAHLIYYKFSLLACSLTSYSWYLAAVPHLHHTLIIPVYFVRENEQLWRPDSFRRIYELGLFPLVKKFHVHGVDSDAIYGRPVTFSAKHFDSCILHQFSTLTNIRELGIDNLDISSFMPNIRQYFGHFSPTVQSLALRKPKGSRRQIIFFIGLFQHLEDVKLLYDLVDFQEEPADDLTLIPSFVPPLQGRLTMSCFTRVGILEDMIGLFGGIRFRHMDLFYVHGIRLLLDACAETLETLRLYPNDPRGEEFFLEGVEIAANNFAARTSPQDFDLSRNKSLRRLEVTARCVGATMRVDSFAMASSLKHALSTITSPIFSEVVAVYRDYDFGCIHCHLNSAPTLYWPSPTLRAVVASEHRRRFEGFYEMHKARGFKLVLCVDVWDHLVEYAVRELECVITTEKVEGGLGALSSEPAVTRSPRGPRPTYNEMFSPRVLRSGYVHAQVSL